MEQNIVNWILKFVLFSFEKFNVFYILSECDNLRIFMETRMRRVVISCARFRSLADLF